MATSFIEKLRAKREQRVAANKAAVNNERVNFLNESALPKSVKLWWAKEGCEVKFRILPFLVTKTPNMGNNLVDDVANVRIFKVHYLPNNRTIVCPTSYGHKCPLCEKYYSYSEDERKDRKSPAQRFRAKNRVVFNAVFEIPDESGKNKLVVRVVDAGAFASWDKLMEEIKNEAELKQNAKFADRIYDFDSPDQGYWIEARMNKASISGNDKDAFMQFTRVTLRWKDNAIALPDKVFEMACDLDMLIPDAPSADELKKLIGEDDEEQETKGVATAVPVAEVDDEADEIPMTYEEPETSTIEDEIDGEEPVTKEVKDGKAEPKTESADESEEAQGSEGDDFDKDDFDF